MQYWRCGSQARRKPATNPFMLAISQDGNPCERAEDFGDAGEPKRKVCPYLLGQSSEGGVNVLYSQYEGYSSRGLQEGGSSANWCCNRISDIASAEIVDEPWHQPMQKPKTRGSCVVSVDAEVEDYYEIG
jgi:hypothetical protein